MLHPQAVAALALWSQGPSVTDPGFGRAHIDELRRVARADAAAEPKEEVAHVEDVDAGGVPARLYRPGALTGGQGVVVFLHGGGFVFGDVDTHDAQARRIANRTGLAVLAVDYRRPPEHTFPAAPDDVDTALGWLSVSAASVGLDITRTVALGDSAGGNLALVAALRNPQLFAATVLVYPFLDPQARFPSYREENGGLTASEAAWYWRQYAASAADLTDPDLAPLDSVRLGTLPPTLVIAAEHDILCDEDEELA
ncbi:MAG TPA: alpha/beta hydrolase, partial [Nocardioidaceae bacterium]|nr:alpha/beta hydrolase [Nocardioidaceae bacterium]